MVMLTVNEKYENTVARNLIYKDNIGLPVSV